MDNEKLINMWRKRCIKGGHTPTALVCVNSDGFPVIFSHHETETLEMVWKHLASAPIVSESKEFEKI
jgi:hypothetical protein